jgi:hypothetical protein
VIFSEIMSYKVEKKTGKANTKMLKNGNYYESMLKKQLGFWLFGLEQPPSIIRRCEVIAKKLLRLSTILTDRFLR